MYDRSNANTYPSDPVLMRYNTIGSYNWSTPGQWIEWSFNVTQAGYYNIAVRARQNYQRAYPSNRRITIDGKVPFAGDDAGALRVLARLVHKDARG